MLNYLWLKNDLTDFDDLGFSGFVSAPNTRITIKISEKIKPRGALKQGFWVLRLKFLFINGCYGFYIYICIFVYLFSATYLNPMDSSFSWHHCIIIDNINCWVFKNAPCHCMLSAYIALKVLIGFVNFKMLMLYA